MSRKASLVMQQKRGAGELKPYQMQNLEIAASKKLFLKLENSKLLKAKTLEIRDNSDKSKEKASEMVFHPSWSLIQYVGYDCISPKPRYYLCSHRKFGTTVF